jgi:metallo-beta-lactamase family protein
MEAANRRDGSAALQFLGATGSVTGSRFLVETPHARVLVDCGLYQGRKELRLRNWDPFPVEPGTLDAVLLSHAHVDHSAYLPALVRDGFGGSVFATRRTAELCRIVLPDAARLQEEDAAFANRAGFSKHHPALALYGAEDAERALALLRPVAFDRRLQVADGISVTFRRAGHILGSASILVEIEERVRVLFSGDLGRPVHPLLEPPAPPAPSDAIVCESTYGDREHAEADAIAQLEAALLRTFARGGVVLIPAFAVDRTEILLFHLRHLMQSGSVPSVPVYADSPMALAALRVYRDAVADGDPEIRRELRGSGDPFDPGHLIEARGVAESKAIHGVEGPAIVVSASGMATGGRVLHHLVQRLPDPRNSVFLVGYQAEETRGRRLLEHPPLLKMHGRYVPVRAEIVDLTGLSAHADRSELLAWLGSAAPAPAISYVVHGEREASQSLCAAIRAKLGRDAVAPGYLERVRLIPA